VPLLLAVGAVKESPVAENGQIQVAKVMTINATFDHRIIDGFHASVMAKVLREWLEHPFERFDPLGSAPRLDAPGDAPGVAPRLAEHGNGAGAPIHG
jgi:pyruvate dehydrogenase E2 component (dihydrolipoamide acetyltransferase)